MADGFIPPHGGYANLLSYRKAEIVYDTTYDTFRKGIEHRDPGISANVIVGLIKAANSLAWRLRLPDSGRLRLCPVSFPSGHV
jgi:hypothetical protein